MGQLPQGHVYINLNSWKWIVQQATTVKMRSITHCERPGIMTGKDLFYGLELQMRIIIRYIYLAGAGSGCALATLIRACDLRLLRERWTAQPRQQQRGGIPDVGQDLSFIPSRSAECVPWSCSVIMQYQPWWSSNWCPFRTKPRFGVLDSCFK